MPTGPNDEPPIDDTHPPDVHPPDMHPEVLPAPVPQGPVIEQPAKLIRIAAMIRELLEDVRHSKPDEAGRKRLRIVYERALAGLKEGVSKELQDELETLTIPLDSTSSESEIRLAQAQLVGWLEGLFQGIQAALWSQQMQARAEIEGMRRHRGLPPGPGAMQPREPGQYL
ncbi:MAG: proteasome activator [Candidatus Rokuibacteriota bacterium]